jgi:crossover junction endodeoxyribonuclease RusA
VGLTPRDVDPATWDRIQAALASGAATEGRPAVLPGVAAPDASGAVTFDAPYPPTLNTYWRRVGEKTLISERGRAYRRAVVARLAGCRPLAGPLKCEAVFHPPDGRRRDLDNLPKALLDAMQHAGLYADDSQVRRLDVRFGKVVKGGHAVVTLTPLGAET